MKRYTFNLNKNTALAENMHLALIVALFLFSMTIIVFGLQHPEALGSHADTPVAVKLATIDPGALDAKVCDSQSVDCDIEGEIRQIAEEHGADADYLVALAKCESTLDPLARGDSGQSRGLFQLHNGYHPEVTDDCAFDIRCSTEWTIDHLDTVHWTCESLID